MNHQRTKEVVCPIDPEKGLFILPQFILVTSANELRLDPFQLLAIDPTSPQKQLNFGNRKSFKIALTDVLLRSIFFSFLI